LRDFDMIPSSAEAPRSSSRRWWHHYDVSDDYFCAANCQNRRKKCLLLFRLHRQQKQLQTSPAATRGARAL